MLNCNLFEFFKFSTQITVLTFEAKQWLLLMIGSLIRWVLATLGLIHDHGERECAALTDTRRVDMNTTLCGLNDLLHNCQPQTNPFTIDRSCALQFAKAREKLGHVFLSYAYARILDWHF